MTMKKRLAICWSTMLALVVMLAAPVFASDIIIDSGYCGEANGKNAAWSINTAGCLRISGSGHMEDYGRVAQMDNFHTATSDFRRPPWYKYRGIIQTIELDGVENAGNYAFANLSNVKSVAFSGVIIIGSFAFQNSVQSDKVDIPNGVAEVRLGAFEGSRVKEWKIPKTVTSIGWMAFNNTTPAGGQQTVFIDDDNGTYTVWNNVILSRDGTVIYCPDNFSEITFPEGVRCIEQYACSFCRKLLKVQLPNGLERIGNSAFARCGKLAEVSIPASLTYIASFGTASDPFYGDDNLTLIKYGGSRTAWEAVAERDYDNIVAFGESERIRLKPSPCLESEIRIADSMGIIPEEEARNLQKPISRLRAAECIYLLLKDDLSTGEIKSSFVDTQSESVLRLSDSAILRGKGDGFFDPDGIVTRAEAATILYRVYGFSYIEYQCPFKDVPLWAQPAVGWAASSGVTKGVGPERYDSDRPITAEEFISMIARGETYKNNMK